MHAQMFIIFYIAIQLCVCVCVCVAIQLQLQLSARLQLYQLLICMSQQLSSYHYWLYGRYIAMHSSQLYSQQLQQYQQAYSYIIIMAEVIIYSHTEKLHQGMQLAIYLATSQLALFISSQLLLAVASYNRQLSRTQPQLHQLASFIASASCNDIMLFTKTMRHAASQLARNKLKICFITTNSSYTVIINNN